MGKMYVLREQTEDDTILKTVGIATCETDAIHWAGARPDGVIDRQYKAMPIIDTEMSTTSSSAVVASYVEDGGAVAKALCELKKAGDYIAKQGNELGGGRLHRIADEAADAVGLEITESA